MAWKTLHLSRPARLSLRDTQIVIAQEDGEARLAIEDLACVILDAPQTTLTASLLSACMEAGVAILGVDSRHMPNGLTLPFHRHHRQGRVAAIQAGIGEVFRKRCWRRIVIAKIENQAAHLARLGRDGATVARLAKRVGSGDPENCEAQAARLYWRRLFDDFRRDDEADLRNKMLNYGYAVVRAGVARALVAHGLLPAFGLHHAGAANAFNLADDLVEPFRPFVDGLVFARADTRASTEELTLDDRRALAGALVENGRIGRETITLLIAAEMAAASLVQAMETGSAELLRLPILADARGDRAEKP